jgi:hypothetical protein
VTAQIRIHGAGRTAVVLVHAVVVDDAPGNAAALLDALLIGDLQGGVKEPRDGILGIHHCVRDPFERRVVDRETSLLQPEPPRLRQRTRATRRRPLVLDATGQLGGT